MLTPWAVIERDARRRKLVRSCSCTCRALALSLSPTTIIKKKYSINQFYFLADKIKSKFFPDAFHYYDNHSNDWNVIDWPFIRMLNIILFYIFFIFGGTATAVSVTRLMYGRSNISSVWRLSFNWMFCLFWWTHLKNATLSLKHYRSLWTESKCTSHGLNSAFSLTKSPPKREWSYY